MAGSNKHTLNDLYQMQSLPLNDKVSLTERRIREWVERYGEENVYISFSGGKDSNVLLDIARRLYPNIKAVFVDTGLEYPDIRDWVKTFDNVEWIKPEYTFKEIIQKYGYPFISKEISEYVYYAKQHIAEDDCLDPVCRICGIGKYKGNACNPCDIHTFDLDKAHWSIKALCGVLGKDMGTVPKGTPDKERSRFNCEKYSFFLEDGAPPISNQCCNVMKKIPIHSFEHKTGLKGITAQMATESHLRVQHWMKNGCNGFDMEHPISHPMAFWTEQDALQYILDNHLPICPIYGEIMEDYTSEGQIVGQLSFTDYGDFDGSRPVLKTTGCERTGCVFCGYGLHIHKSPNHLEKLSVSHPNLYDYVMRGGAFDEGGIWRPDNRGLGYWYCIEWINKHGGFHIVYTNRDYYLNTYMTEETKKYL